MPHRMRFPQRHFALAVFAVLSSLSCGRVSRHLATNVDGTSPSAGSTDVDGNQDDPLAGGTDGHGGANTGGASGGSGGTSVMPDPAMETMPWKSGSRLRARIWDGGDGAKLFMNWEDTKLGIACLFLKGADGTWHCQPDLDRIQYCPADVHDDFSRYVAATEMIDMTTRPLSAKILIAEDGSRENAGLFDVIHGVPCYPVPDEGNTCLPLAAAVINESSSCPSYDTSCSACPTAAFTWPQSETWEPLYGCHGKLDTYTFVPASTDNTGCAAPYDRCSSKAVSDRTYPRTPIARFGTGNLRAEFFVDSAGRPVRNAEPPTATSETWSSLFQMPHPGFYDVNQDNACALTKTKDGEKLQCVPWPYFAVRDVEDNSECAYLDYADPTCSTPIFIEGGGCGSPTCADRFFVLTSGSAYELAAQFDDLRIPTAYWRTESGECTPDTRLDPDNTGVIASRATPLPFSALTTVATYVE